MSTNQDTDDEEMATEQAQGFVDAMPELATIESETLGDAFLDGGEKTTETETEMMPLSDTTLTAREMDIIAIETKEWVPYEGVRGGRGWRNTVNQRVVYDEDPPETTADVDVDEIDMDDVNEVQISSLPVMDELDPRDADVGRPVEVRTDAGRIVDGEITESTDDSITVTDERGQEREFDIANGEVDGAVYMEYPSFYADGIAGTEQSLLPETGEPNDAQLAAEALRRAAEIDSYYETDKMEEYVGEVRSRGVEEERVAEAVNAAIDAHPGLQDYEYDDIMGTDTNAATQAAYRYVPLADLPLTHAEMDEIVAQEEAWSHVSVAGGVGWHDTMRNDVVFASTPAGVPQNYIYVRPNEDVGSEYDVVESDAGGRYRSPVPESEMDDYDSSEDRRFTGELRPEDLDAPTDDSLPDIEPTEVAPEQFTTSVEDLIEREPEMGAFLSEHPPEELEDHRLLQTSDGTAGVAISPDGDIQNLHKTPDAPDGAGEAMLREAIEAGGRTLDNYDTFLTQLYGRNGFREAARMKFNPEYAPEEWDYDSYAQPDVVFMYYDPEEEYEQSDEYIDATEWGETKASAADRADFDAPAPSGGAANDATQAMSENNNYDPAADVQDMVDRAVERDGAEYVRENIDSLLAGLNVVMNVPDKSELDIPTKNE